MSEQKQLQYFSGTYMGRQFSKKFDNEDGTSTKSYRLEFKETENSQYTTKVWAYDNTKGFELLEEGNLYTVGYVEDHYEKNGKQVTSRKGRFITEYDESKSPSNNTNNKGGSSPRGTTPKTTATTGDTFWQDKEKDIRIGQAINLAMAFFQLTNQTDLKQENFNRVVEQMYAKLEGARTYMLKKLSEPKFSEPDRIEEEAVLDDVSKAEIEDVKRLVKDFGEATIDQLTHKFGEGTVKMILDSDLFSIQGDKVTLK